MSSKTKNQKQPISSNAQTHSNPYENVYAGHLPFGPKKQGQGGSISDKQVNSKKKTQIHSNSNPYKQVFAGHLPSTSENQKQPISSNTQTLSNPHQKVDTARTGNQHHKTQSTPQSNALRAMREYRLFPDTCASKYAARFTNQQEVGVLKELLLGFYINEAYTGRGYPKYLDYSNCPRTRPYAFTYCSGGDCPPNGDISSKPYIDAILGQSIQLISCTGSSVALVLRTPDSESEQESKTFKSYNAGAVTLLAAYHLPADLLFRCAAKMPTSRVKHHLNNLKYATEQIERLGPPDFAFLDEIHDIADQVRAGIIEECKALVGESNSDL
jgi:hypothetical protein